MSGKCNLFLGALTGAVLAASMVSTVHAALPAKVGAFYFEGWYTEPPSHPIAIFANEDLRTNFPERRPIWSPEDTWQGDTVAQMEQQINLAADHGVAFFSFCWYWQGSVEATIHHGMNRGLKNFLLASNNDRMQFNINLVNRPDSPIADAGQWQQVIDLWMPALTHPQYLHVNGKPLVTAFDSWMIDQDRNAILQTNAIDNGLAGVELAANTNWFIDPSNSYYDPAHDGVYDHVTRYNSVPGWGKPEVEKPFQTLVDDMEAKWDSESTSTGSYIPTVMTGWDARPWNHAPMEYYTRGTAEEFAAHLQNAIDWMEANPDEVTDDHLMMIFAWNEFGEGGYLAPTAGDPNGAYLNALAQVLGVPEPSSAVLICSAALGLLGFRRRMRRRS